MISIACHGLAVAIDCSAECNYDYEMWAHGASCNRALNPSELQLGGSEVRQRHLTYPCLAVAVASKSIQLMKGARDKTEQGLGRDPSVFTAGPCLPHDCRCPGIMQHYRSIWETNHSGFVSSSQVCSKSVAPCWLLPSIVSTVRWNYSMEPIYLKHIL